jgi:SAM-dependent methyltransferase
MENYSAGHRDQSKLMKLYDAPLETELPWDRAAQGWNKHSSMIAAWLDGASAEMLSAAKIGTGMAVLDIAAGAGDQTFKIARLVGSTGRVLATDLSPVILKLAHEKAQQQGYHCVDTKVLDAQQLGLSGANFDAAVSQLGLMFCQSPQTALEQALQALKPGGYYAALVFSRPQMNPCLVITLECARRHSGHGEAAEFIERDYYQPGGLMSLGEPGFIDRLLYAAGFTSVKVRSLSAPLHLENVELYIDFLRSAASPIIEILSNLSPAAQAVAWSDMARQLERFNHAGGWTGPNELLLCEAQKPIDLIA